MARAAFVAVIVILLYCQFASSDTPPYNNINPIFDPCERVGVCGRGNCVHVTNNTLGYVCECESGWRQARLQEDAFLAFLPCVFPNCILTFLKN